jgi:hypothetical protein
MKFSTERAYADPEVTARKLIEVANSVYIELITGHVRARGYTGGIQGRPRPRDHLRMAHNRPSGTFVRLTRTGADLFA